MHLGVSSWCITQRRPAILKHQMQPRGCDTISAEQHIPRVAPDCSGPKDTSSLSNQSTAVIRLERDEAKVHQRKQRRVPLACTTSVPRVCGSQAAAVGSRRAWRLGVLELRGRNRKRPLPLVHPRIAGYLFQLFARAVNILLVREYTCMKMEFLD